MQRLSFNKKRRIVPAGSSRGLLKSPAPTGVNLEDTYDTFERVEEMERETDMQTQNLSPDKRTPNNANESLKGQPASP